MPIYRVNRIVHALLSICVEAEHEDAAIDFATEDLFDRMAGVGIKAHVEYHELDEARETDAAEKAEFPAPLLAFVEQMARMTTPEDEYAAEGEEGDELRARYDDADDYRADLDDDRLCGEFDAFITMISEARKLLA